MELPAERIPNDIAAKAREIGHRWGSYPAQKTEIGLAVAELLIAERLSATEIERARWKPAAVYFERYCQDEADDVENCVCGAQQHDDAKAFAAAIRSQP